MMEYPINGFHDFHTILANERKIGGVIEAEQIQLRSGETFDHPVFTNIDYTGAMFYSIGFVTSKGVTMIVNVQDISAIKAPTHKRVAKMKNRSFKKVKLEERLQYLKRLSIADQGAFTKPYIDEVTLIVEDIGMENVTIDINLNFINNKLIKIA